MTNTGLTRLLAALGEEDNNFSGWIEIFQSSKVDGSQFRACTPNLLGVLLYEKDEPTEAYWEYNKLPQPLGLISLMVCYAIGEGPPCCSHPNHNIYGCLSGGCPCRKG